MQVKLNVILDEQEDGDTAKVVSKLMDMGFYESPPSGDADGRRWLMFNGSVEEDKLDDIVFLISN